MPRTPGEFLGAAILYLMLAAVIAATVYALEIV
jgi:hypothetical protein